MRKGRSKATMLIILVLVSCMSLLSSFRVEVGKADNASATVYIICLSGVSGTTFNGGSINPAQTANGAVAACTYNSVIGSGLPNVHPAFGMTPPFYSVSYQVVTGWSTYQNIIQTGTDCIVVNTHGQILPVPTGFTATAWIQQIGNAMLTRGLTWVHTSGYPFSQMWYEGASAPDPTNWAPAGFQTLMALIGLGSATCSVPPGGSNTGLAPLDPAASSTLGAINGGNSGWVTSSVANAQTGCPLSSSLFQGYLALPIWDQTVSGTTYYTGAVISFVNANQRYKGGNQQPFGAYVHISTDLTFGSAPSYAPPLYGSDYERGYIGTAAALWNELEAFPRVGDSGQSSDGGTTIGVTVAPVITSCSYNTVTGGGNYYLVNICYGILGMMKTNDMSQQFGQECFELTCPNDCQVELLAQNGASKIGNYVQSATELSGLNDPSVDVNIASTAQYLLALAITTGTAATILTGIGGVLVIAGWATMVSQINSGISQGIDSTTSQIFLFYTPQTYAHYVEPGDGYKYGEFESMLVVQLYIPATGTKGATLDRNAWSVIPLDWSMYVEDSGSGAAAIAASESPISLFQQLAYTCYTTAFYQNFENSYSEWSVSNNSPTSNAEWGLSDGMMYCAGVGTCSYFLSNPPCANIDPYAALYDSGMNTSLTLPLNTFLSGYQGFEICFSLMYDFNPCYSGDYMTVDYQTSTGSWSQLCKFNSAGAQNDALNPFYYEYNGIPSTAQAIQFRFCSDPDINYRGDGAYYWGVYIDDVEIRGILPEYSLSVSVSPNANAGTTSPCVPGTVWQQYNGSWLLMTASANSPYVFGDWIMNSVNFFTANPIVIDFTQNMNLVAYFYIPTSGGHGGGCPYVYDWNGSAYAKDNNILPASENGNGTETKDYYLLQQPLVPMFSTKQKSVYSLQIGEFENNIDYIDQVKLIAVDHSGDTGIAVTQQGQIVSYKNLASPISCVDNNGNNELAAIDSMNGNVSDPSTYYQGNKGDWLVLDFGKVTGPYADLILRDDEKCAECIDLQVPNATGGWQTIDVLNPRDYWSMEAVNMAAYIPKTGDFIIRLLWTQSHRLDFVGLDTSPPAPVEVSTASPTLAIHSTMGDVTAKLMYDDTQCVELINGQYITIWFTLPSQPHDTTRSFILYTDGYYYTITS
jgi:hypothetical protein